MSARGGVVGSNVGAWHAWPVAMSSHNAAKVDTALNDTLPYGRRMHRPYTNWGKSALRIIRPRGCGVLRM